MTTRMYNTANRETNSRKNKKLAEHNVAQWIQAIDDAAALHEKLFYSIGVKKSGSARRKWLRLVIRLSETDATSIEEAVQKTGYIRQLCELCLLDLALSGIFSEEVHGVMQRLVDDIESWGIPLSSDTRH